MDLSFQKSRSQNIPFSIDFILSPACSSEMRSTVYNDRSRFPTESYGSDSSFESDEEPMKKPALMHSTSQSLSYKINDTHRSGYSYKKCEKSARKKCRRTINSNQLSCLEETYIKLGGYMSLADRQQLAEQLLLKESQIRTWFQSRRSKERKEKRTLEDRRNISSQPLFQNPLLWWHYYPTF